MFEDIIGKEKKEKVYFKLCPSCYSQYVIYGTARIIEGTSIRKWAAQCTVCNHEWVLHYDTDANEYVTEKQHV